MYNIVYNAVCSIGKKKEQRQSDFVTNVEKQIAIRY